MKRFCIAAVAASILRLGHATRVWLSRVGGADGLRGTWANDRLAPPLIKPDGRFSRIRLSEGASTAGLVPAVTVNLAVLETLSGVHIQVALAISDPVAVSFHTHPSAPPSLPIGFTIRRINATTQDSDYSGGLRQLGGDRKSVV